MYQKFKGLQEDQHKFDELCGILRSKVDRHGNQTYITALIFLRLKKMEIVFIILF
jgi:hypothetical protein